MRQSPTLDPINPTNHPMLKVRTVGFVLLFVGCIMGAIGWVGALGLNHYSWFILTKYGTWIASGGAACVIAYFAGRFLGFSPKA